MSDRAAKIAEVQKWLDGVHAEIDKQNYAPYATTVYPDADVLDATGAPPPPGSTPLTDEEKQVRKEEEYRKKQERGDARFAEFQERAEHNKYNRELKKAKDKLAEEERRKKQEEAQRTASERTVRTAIALGEQVFQTGARVGRRVRDRLGQIPTPGDIIVPLSILLLFFFVLFPVNGHTRLTWLWMVITKNAEIGGALPQPTVNPVTPQQQPAQTVAQQLQQFAQSSVPMIPYSAFNNPPPPGAGPSGNPNRNVVPPVQQHAPGHGPTGGGPSGNSYHKMSYAEMMQEGLNN